MKIVDKIYKIKLGIIKPKSEYEKKLVEKYGSLFGFSPSKAAMYIRKDYIDGLELGSKSR